MQRLECIRSHLVEYSSMAARIVLVIDNLNIHHLSSLYKTLGPAEAQGLTARLRVHYILGHGSWLSVAEIEQSVLA
ncbi:transposase [Salinibacter altiplanensis]|uniref:transposase n=1 Tax=Salinibacter altiplanensis TaxID=1803181 RepID=UPI001319FF4C